MEAITFGCSATNKLTSGNYDYFLYSRIDDYALIMRAKTDGTEWLVRVIEADEDIATVWANATSETYVRPDALSSGVKQYVVTKMKEYINANRPIANSW